VKIKKKPLEEGWVSTKLNCKGRVLPVRERGLLVTEDELLALIFVNIKIRWFFGNFKI